MEKTTMTNIMKNVQKIMNHSEASEYNNRRLLDGLAWKAYNEYERKMKAHDESAETFATFEATMKPQEILDSVPATRAYQWMETHKADAEVWLTIYAAAQADYKAYTGTDYYHPNDPAKPALSDKDGTKAAMLKYLESRAA